MTKNEIDRALKLLGEKLKGKNGNGYLILVGGASLCLVHDARENAHDVDAIYEPKSGIDKLAKEVATELNLSNGWLNDNVSQYVNKNMPSDFVATHGALKIMTATPEYLLAMKMNSACEANRKRDIEDLKFLLEKVDIKSPEEASNLLEKYFPTKSDFLETPMGKIWLAMAPIIFDPDPYRSLRRDLLKKEEGFNKDYYIDKKNTHFYYDNKEKNNYKDFYKKDQF